MTRYEYLKEASLEEMAELLCCMMEDLDSDEYVCNLCVATNLCKPYCNGFREWLKQECDEALVEKKG